MAKGLTKRQEEVLQYICDYVEENGFPPSIREIGDKCFITSLRGVTVHLDALQRKGFIERGKQPRSIRVVQNGRPERGLVKFLPLVGQIAAGVPILASENVEAMIPVPADLVRTAESAFCLRVKGESMVGEGIRPRDLVIIRPQPTANHNDLIAARIDDEATVKRIHFDQDDRSIVRLMPSNPAFEPIVASRDEVHVIGRVIGLWRDYDSMAF